MNKPKLFSVVSFFFLLLTISIFPPARTFAQACSQIKTAPAIYQINRTETTATLHINPINESVKSYTIFYGFSAGDERYSTTFDYGATTGAIVYTLSGLDPKVGYYYKIRANNQCSNGPSSEWVADSIAKAQVTGSSTGATPVTGFENVFLIAGISLLTMLFGVALFRF